MLVLVLWKSRRQNVVGNNKVVADFFDALPGNNNGISSYAEKARGKLNNYRNNKRIFKLNVYIYNKPKPCAVHTADNFFFRKLLK